MKKYKIEDCMDNLNFKTYQVVNRLLPKLLGVSHNTINNYKKMKIEDKKDIPYCSVRKLELLFDLKPGELLNQKIEGKSYTQILREITKN